MEGFLEECVRVLRRFKQMILQGPPGTGKTRAAKLVVAEMLEVDGEKIDSPEYRGKRWDIVQFHPSYGYEDFVRGIRVKTEKGGAIYETVDRHFGVMAKRAFDNPGDKHFLIIDEINRANVAAVLGELIYGLEYRGDKITTQYAVEENDFSLVVPKNLFVIGTMNTADRTIGHIDYAVRRRFAFQTLPPDRAVVKNKSDAPSALSLFEQVSALFYGDDACVSGDFHASDVAVGHSYFLAKDDGELRDKMLFQVVPILEEYLRDGVLNEDARAKIGDIKSTAEQIDKSVESVTPEFALAARKQFTAFGDARWYKNSSDESLALMLKVVDGIASNQWELNPTPLSDYLGYKNKQSGKSSNAFRFQPRKNSLRVVVAVSAVNVASISQFDSRFHNLGGKQLNRAYRIRLTLQTNFPKAVSLLRDMSNSIVQASA